MILVLRMLGVVLLVGLNAFFVASEFALVAMRASRIQQLIEAGDLRARIVKGLLAESAAGQLRFLDAARDGGLTLREAVKPLAKHLGVSASELYKLAAQR